MELSAFSNANKYLNLLVTYLSRHNKNDSTITYFFSLVNSENDLRLLFLIKNNFQTRKMLKLTSGCCLAKARELMTV